MRSLWLHPLVEPREQRYLRNIEQLTKQKIGIEKVPTIVDLRTRRLELTRAAIEEAIAAGDLDQYRVVVETLSGDHDIVDIATAAVRLAHEAQGKDAEGTDIPEVAVAASRTGRGAGGEGGERQES